MGCVFSFSFISVFWHFTGYRSFWGYYIGFVKYKYVISLLTIGTPMLITISRHLLILIILSKKMTIANFRIRMCYKRIF